MKSQMRRGPPGLRGRPSADPRGCLCSPAWDPGCTEGTDLMPAAVHRRGRCRQARASSPLLLLPPCLSPACRRQGQALLTGVGQSVPAEVAIGLFSNEFRSWHWQTCADPTLESHDFGQSFTTLRLLLYKIQKAASTLEMQPGFVPESRAQGTGCQAGGVMVRPLHRGSVPVLPLGTNAICHHHRPRPPEEPSV